MSIVIVLGLIGVFMPEQPGLWEADGNFDAANVAWMITATIFVLMMTPGLSFFYGGMVGQKNVISTILQSFIAMGIISVLWVAFGFSLAFGEDVGGFIGNPATFFMFKDVGAKVDTYLAPTIPLALYALFQMKFAIITPSLITGSFAERVRFSAYLVFMILFCIFVYCPLAHWTWHPDGFLRQLGVVDFAGGIVVHASSGVAALTGAIFLGRRKQQDHHDPANIPFVILGAAMLWLGWFGFNAGSALGANALAASAFVVSQAAAAAATVSWVLMEWKFNGKPTVLGAVSGCIAGLVAITPAAGFVEPLPAIIIGLIGGGICYFAVAVLKDKLGYDDSLDAFGIHGIGGTWGSLATGLWATTGVNPAGANGLFYGETDLFVAQVISTVVAYALAIVGTFILFKIVSAICDVRADESEELAGLDIVEHGERGYGRSVVGGTIMGSFEDSSEMLANTVMKVNAKGGTI